MLREKSQPMGDMQTSSASCTGDAGSDEALAARGDSTAFVQLYRTYLTPVYRYLYARLGNRQEAEDLTSLTFERAWTSLPGYRPTGSFKGWLFTIASRALADHLRASRPPDVPVDDLSGSLADPSSGPEDAALQSDQLRQVLAMIAQLGPDGQEVITLRFMAEMRYAEISHVMGKSEAAVKMIAYRALEEIKRRLANSEQGG